MWYWIWKYDGSLASNGSLVSCKSVRLLSHWRNRLHEYGYMRPAISFIFNSLVSFYKTPRLTRLKSQFQRLSRPQMRRLDEPVSYRLRLCSRIATVRLACTVVAFFYSVFVTNYSFRHFSAIGFRWLVHAVGCASGRAALLVRNLLELGLTSLDAAIQEACMSLQLMKRGWNAVFDDIVI
jgi:hypothetical protein